MTRQGAPFPVKSRPHYPFEHALTYNRLTPQAQLVRLAPLSFPSTASTSLVWDSVIRSLPRPIPMRQSEFRERPLRWRRPAATVKGCPTPARAKRLATAGSELRAGVGQASREETAGHTAVVGTG